MTVLTTAGTPEKAEAVAVALCRKGDEQSVGVVLDLLREPKFWAALDSEDDYDAKPRDLRLGKVLHAVVQLEPKQANRIVVALAKDKGFMDHPKREGVLIRACAGLKAPSKEVLSFLDERAPPGSWQKNIVMSVLGSISTAESCQLIEKRVFSPDYELSTKRSWLIDDLLPFRDNQEVVKLYRRILARPDGSPALRDALVEALFDYRPKEWYHSTRRVLPKPPDRRGLSPERLRELLALADHAGKFPLSEQAAKSLKKGREEIQVILKFHQTGGPKHIAKLIADLDDKKFPVREQAQSELAKYGDWAEPALRAALERDPSLELRQRLLKLLDPLQK